MKKKMVIMVAIGMMMAILGGCTVVDETIKDAKKDMEWTDDHAARTDGNDAGNSTASAIPDEGINEDANKDANNGGIERVKHQIGDTVTLETEDGAQMEVTLTDWGYDSNTFTNEKLLYVGYEIKNVGNVSFTISNAIFNIYADDYNVEQSYSASSDMSVASAELSAGRKVAGRVYGNIDPDSVETIDLEIGDVIFAIKDGNVLIDSLAATPNTEIPSDMVRDESFEIDPLEIAGEYVGLESDSIMNMQSTVITQMRKIRHTMIGSKGMQPGMMPHQWRCLT